MSEDENKVAQESPQENQEPQVDTQSDVNARAQEFIKEYGALVEKHKMDFATYPMFVPDGTGGFKIVCQNTPVDISNQPVKSPVIVTE